MPLFHQEIAPGFFHIGDGRDNFCTLVVGSSSAVLFDTMMGFDDLKSYVARLTPFSPMVINSHAHFDHIGGNFQFPCCYLNPLDLPLLTLGLSRVPTLTTTLQADLSPQLPSYSPRLYHPITPGKTLDLGGKTLKVLPLPGHTPGSIGLYCPEEKMLLSGDALSPQYCVFFRESLPLSVSVETLESLGAVDFDVFLSSHFSFPFPAEYVKKFRACLDLPGQKRGMEYVYETLPQERGRFFVLEPFDPAIGQLIGVAVKEEDVTFIPKNKR